MRERDTRTDYTFGSGKDTAAAQARKRRRQLVAGIVILVAIGGAARLGYRHIEPELRRFEPLAPLLNPASKTTRVYRWQDEDGNWQVADRNPGENVVYEVLEYRNDVNVLPRPPQLREAD